MQKRSRKLSWPVQQLIHDAYLKIDVLRKQLDALSSSPHIHDHFELIWITGGDGSHSINFKSYPFVADRIYIIHPGQIHVIPDFERQGWVFIISGQLVYQYLALYPEQEAQGLFNVFGRKPFVDLPPSVAVELEQIRMLLTASLRDENPDSRVIFHLMCFLLLKLNVLHGDLQGQMLLKSNEHSLILRLMELLQKHIRQEHGADFYRSKLGVSPKLLNNICRRAAGKTLKHIIESKLLSEACTLLLSSDVSIKEIAFKLGFSDPSHFGKFFKRAAGITPAAYRQR